MLRLFSTSCLLALVLSGGALAQGGWWGDLFAEETVPLEKLLADPETYRGQRVLFDFQVQGERVQENPFHTRFEKARYLCFAGWPDEAALWRRAVYKAPHQQLFVNRSSPLATTLQTASSYARFRARAEVVEVVAGKPWVEIKALEPLGKALTEPALVHLMKGERFADLGRHGAASREFARASGNDQPEWVRRRALAGEIDALLTLGETEAAGERILLALALSPGDERLARIAKELGLAPPPAPAR